MITIPTALEEFAEYLAQYATQQVLDFRISKTSQRRAEELLMHNHAGTLTLDECLELEQMLYFDRVVLALKAKAFAMLAH